ncbi:LacI family transcriptional regulator [Labedella endophytica]|uniref:LacI family transcriptional regulator n=1 Tax=Labedella endophytica TaxID=1523160 RepID=A0A433JV19_9MICO|nr:LacI family transcriptional regulator [Labedella endophytica]
MRHPPTLEAVAEAAGVSRATVSRVVNGSPRVRGEVVEAVQKAIAELGYVPNRAARSLASSRTHSIALLVPEEVSRFFGDPYFASFTTGLDRRLAASEYVLNLVVARDDPDRKAVRYVRGGNVDGAIVVSHHSGHEFLAQLEGVVPIVFGGRPEAGISAEPYFVDVDNVAGGRLATEHLLGLGRRRIATIAGPVDMTASMDRLAGFRAAMDDAGLPSTAIDYGNFTAPGAAAAMRRLLEEQPDLDGLFVASDLMATGALRVLAARGIRVPDDIAIVGYDDSPAATWGEIGLTTVSQPSELMGATTVDVLLRLLGGDPDVPHANIVPTELIIRESA